MSGYIKPEFWGPKGIKHQFGLDFDVPSSRHQRRALAKIREADIALMKKAKLAERREAQNEVKGAPNA